MTVKQSVLELLLNADGKYMSGEYIAASLNVTRASIWKSIKQLKLEGFMIDAISNKGYAIIESNDIVTEVGIRRHLLKDLPFTFEIHDTVVSTNNLMREKAINNEGLVIVSKEQTHGVGRLDRSFFSPKNTGIYFSLLLKPNLNANETIYITTMAAIAVCKAIEKISKKKPLIKWVNDIYLNGKKTCGILTQGSFSMENNKTEFIILGIGVNVYVPEGGFPKEIADTAGFLFTKQEDNIKNKLIAEVLNCFWDMYQKMEVKMISALYKKYSFVVGKRVIVMDSDRSEPAKVLDINEQCNLVVQYESGEIAVLSSGEISITI